MYGGTIACDNPIVHLNQVSSRSVQNKYVRPDDRDTSKQYLYLQIQKSDSRYNINENLMINRNLCHHRML